MIRLIREAKVKEGKVYLTFMLDTARLHNLAQMIRFRKKDGQIVAILGTSIVDYLSGGRLGGAREVTLDNLPEGVGVSWGINLEVPANKAAILAATASVAASVCAAANKIRREAEDRLPKEWLFPKARVLCNGHAVPITE